MFAYLKEYPHPPGSLLQNELNSDIARFTAHKKNLRTFVFVARQVQKWVRVKRGKHRTSTRLAPMLQNNLQVFCCSFYQVLLRLLKYTCITMLLVY